MPWLRLIGPRFLTVKRNTLQYPRLLWVQLCLLLIVVLGLYYVHRMGGSHAYPEAYKACLLASCTK